MVCPVLYTYRGLDIIRESAKANALAQTEDDKKRVPRKTVLAFDER